LFGQDAYEITFYVQVRYGEKTLNEKNDYQKLIEQVLVYKKPGFRPNKPEVDYTIEKFEWQIKELSPGKQATLGGRKVTIFKKGEYEIVKVPPGLHALKETWASGTVLKGHASGKFFNDHLSGRPKTDGLEVLYKVQGIGEDGLGYRYFTGPKKETATKGKFYSGIPLTRLQELKSGSSKKSVVIQNFMNYADNFGNCRSEGGVELRGGKKPEEFLKELIEMGSKEGDLILDFFLGTGSTAATAMKLGRKFIGIEQIDYGSNDSTTRMKNVVQRDQTGISESVDWQGGGSFIYCELAQANQTFIDRIQDAKTTKTLQKIWDEMQDKAFLSYRIDPKALDLEGSDFSALSLDDQKHFLIEVMDKNILYIPLSEIDDKTYGISDDDKKLNRQFHGQQ
jgi:adenine-specific DNA-methyltransferase